MNQRRKKRQFPSDARHFMTREELMAHENDTEFKRWMENIRAKHGWPPRFGIDVEADPDV